MTSPQKYNKEFETLAEKVVRKLLEGSNAEIYRTRTQKDGGYDIVAENFDGNIKQKVYFECKLRNGNLNLRDIAANVIIAFNEGAIGLVALTNYDYTTQADEQLGLFYQRTILNVKIIIGSEIRRIILENNIKVSDGLLSILQETRTMRKDTTPFLRLDFSKQNLYTQIFQKNTVENPICETFLGKLMDKELAVATQQLQNGYTVVVSGYTGVGKSTFISSILSKCPYHQVHLDGLLYITQEQLLLELFLQIWGIPEKFLIQNLEEEHLKAITSHIGGHENDTETAQIIRSIINMSNTALSHSIQYNCLICRYLLSLLDIHKNNIQYVFYFENLQFCQPEIFQLLTYLVKLLNADEIGCIIEYQEGEYAVQNENLFLPEIRHLKHCTQINVRILDTPHALKYLTHAKPDLSKDTAKLIVSLVGCRLYNLALILNYLEQRKIDFDDPQQIASELNALTPNDIPNIVSKTFSFYRQKHRVLFDLLALLHGFVPIEFLSVIGVELDETDKLIDEQILTCKSGYIVPTNKFILKEILYSSNQFSVRHMKIANLLLPFIDLNPEQYQSAHIYILYHIEQYEEALILLEHYIYQLEQKRQYSALIEYLDIAIDIATKLKSYEKYAAFIVQQLDILVLKKDIVGSKAKKRINELSQVLSSRRITEGINVFQMAHDYFLGKRVFKLGKLNANEISFQTNKNHYEECINGKYSNNTGDWLGRVCCNYAMFVKEMYGDISALTVFQRAITIIPDSFELRREYYSHEACMRLFDAPREACSFYQKVLEMFKSHPERCALPFHEHGDIAMSLLLSGQFNEAIRVAKESVELADSYGVLDEVGRITNIEGCAWLCIGNEQEAERLFVESTAIMERSRYKLYCWRSRLNELQMRLCTSGNKQRLQPFLQKTYDDFKVLLQCKVVEMVFLPESDFFKTREYHALLVFGKCFHLLNASMVENIIVDFGLKTIADTYLSHIRKLIEQPDYRVIKDSPYFCNGKIFMVG